MKHLFAHTLLLLFLLASCSDEELVNGSRPKDGELTEMTFTLCIPQEERVTTRAAASESTVNELYLLVFNTGENGTLVEAHPFSGTELKDATETGSSIVRKKFTAKLKASNTPMDIYVVANANTILENTGLVVGTTTVANVKALKADITEQASGTPFVMSGHKESSIPGVSLLDTDFPLIRSVAKVKVESKTEDFIYESFQLWNGNAEGSILAGCVPDEEVPGRSTPTTDQAIGTSTEDGLLYTYPCKNENSSPFLIVGGKYKGEPYFYRIDLKNETKPLDILPNHHYQVSITKVNNIGYATAAEAAKHPADNKVEATIYDIELDIRNMITDGSLELGVTDRVTIHSGGSDGNPETNTGTFAVKVYQQGQTGTELQSAITAGTLTLTVEPNKEDAFWLSIPESTENGNNPTIETETDTEEGHGSPSYLLYTYTFQAEQNLSGGTREGTIIVRLQSGDMVLEREVIVEQTADFLGYKFVNAELTATQDGNTNLNAKNYWDFLLNRHDHDQETRTTDTEKLYGIQPEDMGGEVRNEGFHFPVNDKMQFTYKLTLPNGNYDKVEWEVTVDERFVDKLQFGDAQTNGNTGTIEISNGLPKGTKMRGQSFTFTTKYPASTATDRTDVAKNYRFGRKALQFILTNTETRRKTVISYDLYHTGIFQHIDNDIINYAVADKENMEEGWYYYEVIPMGGRYWLDRNIGATSSGYYIENGEGGNYQQALEGKVWPFQSASAGALFAIAESAPEKGQAKLINDICPKGYRLPTASEFSALTSDASFHSEYTPVAGGATYWNTYYKFVNTSDESDTREHTSVYFPKNRMFYGGSTSGDANAGYYWTQTEALGASGTEQGHWMQFMKFMGANASLGRVRTTQSGEAGKFNDNQKTGMSVRCINDQGIYDEQVYTWELYIKGYTHVFLYNKETADSDPVYLNTWPGEMITVDDPNALDMYHTFTFSSTTEYKGLHIILNRVTETGQTTPFYKEMSNGNMTGFAVPNTEEEGAVVNVNNDGTLRKSFFIVTESDGTKTGHWSKTSN